MSLDILNVIALGLIALVWGDALERLGRRPAALAAWRLAVGRDPQSESASIARERLAERGPRDVSA